MLKGNIYLKGDKSISHRIVIFGSLANEKSKIYNLSNCSDVMHTIQILKDCGIKIKNDKDFLSVTGNTFTSKQKKFDCGNSGSTLGSCLDYYHLRACMELYMEMIHYPKGLCLE